MKKKAIGKIDRKIIWQGIKQAFVKLDPRLQFSNPVIFVTYLCAVITTYIVAREAAYGNPMWFNLQVAVWLWFTVLFANFAEALAESRGKAHADSLRQVKTQVIARLLNGDVESRVPANELKKGDVVICETQDIIPADGEVIEGIASVDESAITGESAPVIRESGGDRSAVTVGTRVLSDEIKIRVTSEPGKSFLDRMVSLIEGAKRQKTPNEIALNIVLSALTIILLLSVISLKFFADFSAQASHQDISHLVTVPNLAALLVCLIPTTICGLLSSVGIAGIDRLVKLNVIAKSGRSVEAAGDIDVLILDKTGTITLGNRMATAFIPATGFTDKELAECAQLASFSDETPEGRSIVVLAKKLFDLRGENLQPARTRFQPFSAQTRMSGVDVLDDNGNIITVIRKGAIDSIKSYIENVGGTFPVQLEKEVEEVARSGGTPLLVCKDKKVIGLINLKDVIKGGIKERFAILRKMGIRTLMITGDNPLTAAAIAAEAGVDDFIAQATPEMKLERIRKEQESGHLVAMTGDGTNDAPALAQADVGVAMNTGTQATRDAGNMVDLDSNPTKLLEVVMIGKQLLMTRGALTTFSIANDLAKYFALIPAICGTLYIAEGQTHGPLSVLNIMHLHSPESAIISAVIFNALIIIALIPLALKGVQYRAKSASLMLLKNILIYGIGGIAAPFVGIKLIDLLVVSLGIV